MRGIVRKTVKGMIMFQAAVIMMAAAGSAVMADVSLRVLETTVTEDEVIQFVDGAGHEMKEISAWIGMEDVTDISVEANPEEQPIKTWLLLDNSISVPAKNRGAIADLMKGIVEAKLPGEHYSLCTFSDHLEPVMESSDPEELKEQIDAIVYNDQETYITDVAGEVLDADRRESSSDFVRVLMISDGVDNNPEGITRGELESRLAIRNIPIYTIGVKRGGNEAELKEMYALARVSNARFWTLGETETSEIISSLSSAEIPQKISVKIPDEMKDGSQRGFQMIIDNTASDPIQVVMPFGSSTKKEAETVETKEAEEEENVGVTAWLADHLWLFLIVLAVVALVGGVAAVITLVRKKDSFEPYTPPNGRNQPSTEGTPPMQRNIYVPVVRLEEKGQPGNGFEKPLRSPLVIGKNPEYCQMVISYDRSVSGRHCEIFVSGHYVRVRDLGSTNGTFLDGDRVTDSADLCDGSILRLGRTELRVWIR